MLLITGAGGFLGRRLVELAVRRGHRVRAFIRRRQTDEVPLPSQEIYHGDLTDAASVAGAVDRVDAVIHAAATTSESAPDENLSWRTNVEGTKNLLAACGLAGVRRFIQISSLSANPSNTSVYGRTKFAADEEVCRSTLSWTILQPGTIFGPGSRGLFAKMARLTKKLPIVPVFGSGKQTMRPIFVDDAAGAALDCLDHDRCIGATYALGCEDAITFNDFIRGIGRAQGKRKRLLHAPLWFCFPIARLLGLILKNPPVTVDNLVGIKQMKAPDITPAKRDFGFSPLTFKEGLARTFATPLQEPVPLAIDGWHA